MKANFWYQQKSHLFHENIDLCNLSYLAVLKTLKTSGGVMLALTFCISDHICFLKQCFFRLNSFSLLTSKGVLFIYLFLLNRTLSKTIEYISVLFATH